MTILLFPDNHFFFFFKVQDSNYIFKMQNLSFLAMHLIIFSGTDYFVNCFSPLWSQTFIYFILTYGTSGLITTFLSLKRLSDSTSSTFSILRYNSQRSRDFRIIQGSYLLFKNLIYFEPQFSISNICSSIQDISKQMYYQYLKLSITKNKFVIFMFFPEHRYINSIFHAFNKWSFYVIIK